LSVAAATIPVEHAAGKEEKEEADDDGGLPHRWRRDGDGDAGDGDAHEQ
jgi:hypothetical protein